VHINQRKGNDTRIPTNPNLPQQMHTIIVKKIPARQHRLHNTNRISLLNPSLHQTNNRKFETINHPPYLLLLQGIVEPPDIPGKDLHYFLMGEPPPTEEH